MTTKRTPTEQTEPSTPTANAPARAGSGAGAGGIAGSMRGVDVDPAVVAYAGAAAFDVPSFWAALCRYRERHGLANPQSKPLLHDDDLKDLRDTSAPRDFSFDDDDDVNPTPSSIR